MQMNAITSFRYVTVRNVRLLRYSHDNLQTRFIHYAYILITMCGEYIK